MSSTHSSMWRDSLPVLVSSRLLLREVEPEDAPKLVEMFTAEELREFLSQPPSSIDAFTTFARWAHTQRSNGRFICYIVIHRETDAVAGLFQLWPIDPTFGTAEWGMAIAPRFWGEGVFDEAARLLVDFAVSTLGIHRLEARVALQNSRGTAALRRLGAVQEGVLRQCFRCGRDQLMDHVMMSLLADDWKRVQVA